LERTLLKLKTAQVSHEPTGVFSASSLQKPDSLDLFNMARKFLCNSLTSQRRQREWWQKVKCQGCGISLASLQAAAHLVWLVLITPAEAVTVHQIRSQESKSYECTRSETNLSRRHTQPYKGDFDSGTDRVLMFRVRRKENF